MHQKCVWLQDWAWPGRDPTNFPDSFAKSREQTRKEVKRTEAESSGRKVHIIVEVRIWQTFSQARCMTSPSQSTDMQHLISKHNKPAVGAATRGYYSSSGNTSQRPTTSQECNR